ncbi:MAG: 50S ribosomal protein L16 [archaeon]
MATLRVGKCYRNTTRPFTRRSKVKAKSYIKTIPPSKIVRFEMGNIKDKFEYEVNLVSQDRMQIRHNALESARMVVNRQLQIRLGNNYYLQLKAYPHHVLRENKMLSGAHADRLQTGMAHSFGRSVGLAAQVEKGKIIFTAKVNKDALEIAKAALKTATPRIPCRCIIDVKKIS